MNIQSVISAVQTQLNLTADGDAGPVTWKAIYRALFGRPWVDPTPVSSAPFSGQFTPDLEADYLAHWQRATVLESAKAELGQTVARIEAHKDRYQAVEAKTGVPWQLIAALHNMECSLRFDQHLHNGDSLAHRTVNDPPGRPASDGPWTWEESAFDALDFEKQHNWKNLPDGWTLPLTLCKAEAFNGWGYRKYHANVPSPYVWGGTSEYTSGKYVADGKWDENAVSRQIGVASTLKLLGYPLQSSS